MNVLFWYFCLKVLFCRHTKNIFTVKLHIILCPYTSYQIPEFHFMLESSYPTGIIHKLTQPLRRQRKWHSSGMTISLRWRHNELDGVSDHQPHDCLLNSLFGRRSKKTSKLRVTGLCEGNSPGPVNSPHKGPVARKIVPFDDVIMWIAPKGTLYTDFVWETLGQQLMGKQ